MGAFEMRMSWGPRHIKVRIFSGMKRCTARRGDRGGQWDKGMGRWGLLASIIKGRGCSLHIPRGAEKWGSGLVHNVQQGYRLVGKAKDLGGSLLLGDMDNSCPGMQQKGMMDGEANHVVLECGGLIKRRTFLCLVIMLILSLSLPRNFKHPAFTQYCTTVEYILGTLLTLCTLPWWS